MNEDFYTSLKNKLEETSDWPTVYMFKFIIPADNKKLALAEALFNPEAQVTTRESRNGKYISITGKVVMLNPEEVIAKYRKAGEIEGLIAL